MSRNQKKGRRKFDTRMSFDELCRKVGITPKQKIIMRRFVKNKIEEIPFKKK